MTITEITQKTSGPPVKFSYSEWRRHEVLTGGGTDSGPSNPPTPKFRYFLGFRSLYFENLEKFKLLVSSFKKIFKQSRFLGVVPLLLSDWDAPPPGVGTHVANAWKGAFS